MGNQVVKARSNERFIELLLHGNESLSLLWDEVDNG
jgi:hypothetical protein